MRKPALLLFWIFCLCAAVRVVQGSSDWTVCSAPTTSDLNSVFMLGASDAWAVGDEGAVIHWNGVEWSNVSSPTTGTLYSVFGLSSNDVWAVGTVRSSPPPPYIYQPVIMHWDGFSWSMSTYPWASGGFNSAFVVGSNDGWAVGYTWSFPRQGQIMRWNGSSWNSVASPAQETLFSVSMIDASFGVAVGESGTIIRWNGSSWTAVTSPTMASLRSLYMLEGDNGWAVGYDGSVVHFDGVSWSNQTSPTSNHLLSVHMHSFEGAIEGWAVGTAGVIIHWDESHVWSLVTSPASDDLNSVFMMYDGSSGWAVGENGAMIRYDGTTWVPEFPLSTAMLLLTTTAVALAISSRKVLRRRIRSDPRQTYAAHTTSYFPA